MNTLVHIIRFCAQESVAHAQKEHKVLPLLKLVCTLLGYNNITNTNKIGVTLSRMSVSYHLI